MALSRLSTRNAPPGVLSFDAGAVRIGISIEPEHGAAEPGLNPVRQGWPLKSSDALRRENEALRERTSRLHEAVLRISGSLDPATVLQQAVDSARALTGARYGVITTIDDRRARDFVSSGFTAEEHRRLADWPGGRRLFGHLRDLPPAVRSSDFPAYVRSLGIPAGPLPTVSMQATPMRHRGEHVGNLFLGHETGGQEFTGEDQEVLVLFASQAATAIANARRHRNEQRARADLETLIETSPVGVAVFDARTGEPVSFNQEARRIVDRLGPPDQSPGDLLRTMTCRLADGRAIALDSLAPLSSNARVMRAGEIVLSVPDGRSVRLLVNATPIRSADGAIESVVATLQDLTALSELERLQAEFLGMVSHELRAPLTSIKGSAAALLRPSPELDPAELREFHRIIDEQTDHMLDLIGDLLDAGRIEAGTVKVPAEPPHVAGLVDGARSSDLSGGGRQAVRIDLPADLPQVMADRRRIVQVLNNLLSNASRHSPDVSPIRVAAAPDGVHVAISVSDEGQGVTPEQLPHLFRKHAVAGGDRDRRAGGYGLGLAICKGLVEAHGGRIRAESGGPGQGTRFTFTIPVAEEADGGAATGAAASRSHSPAEQRERPRILVVDDDPQTLRDVRDALVPAGFSPILTGDPRELSDLMTTHKPRLVLLDLVLPGTDGIELMQSIPHLADLPVIFVSGYGRDETIARALELGADDYIVKPFSPTELMARVRAALRRRAKPEPFLLGDLAIHYEQRQVTVAGRPVRLTAAEYELLRVLSVNAGRVLTSEALLRRVRSGRDSGDPTLVRTLVKKLRRKLGDDAARPAYVLTERGVGYRIATPDDR
ncbi:MAG: response regulator [Acidobacteria bacterium]|nr:response regulator [Acidobacteriota bacterium]